MLCAVNISCPPPKVLNPITKTCNPPGTNTTCPNGMRPWPDANGNLVCKIDCELKEPTRRTCARVIDKLVWKIDEYGNNVTSTEKEEIECEEGCSYYITNEDGDCECSIHHNPDLNNCTYITEVHKNVTIPCKTEGCEAPTVEVHFDYSTCAYTCEGYYYEQKVLLDPENPFSDYDTLLMCVPNCTETDYCLTNGQRCVNECPHDWFLNINEYGDRCMPTCNALNYMCQNNKLFMTDEKCGPVKYAQAQCCSTSCPVGMVRYGNICVGQCPAGTTKVVDECVGTNKIAMWIWIVISIAIAFIIAIVIFVILLMKKKRKGIQRVKSRKGHSGKTVYYSNKIKEY